MTALVSLPVDIPAVWETLADIDPMWGVGMLIGVVAINVGLVAHELAHYAVARWYGYRARIRLEWFGPLIIAGECVLHPYVNMYDSNRMSTNISRRISMAPLALLVGSAALGYVATRPVGPTVPPSVENATVLVAIIGMFLGIPSPGDVGATDHDNRTVCWTLLQDRCRNHRAAEGYGGPAADELLAELADRAFDDS